MAGNTLQLRGHLRLRFSNLKNNIQRLTAVIESLRYVAGVEAVEASPFTGGMLIHYAPAAGETRKFWDDVEAMLEVHGLHHDPRPFKHRSNRLRQGGGGAVRAAAAI